MSRELQDWLKNSDFRAKRELVGKIKEQADRLADAIQAAARVKTGRLRDSIKVRRTRNQLKFYVTAGGSETSPGYRRNARYQREVAIGSGDTANIARGTAAGVVFDYSRALEFGTTKMSARPFFYPTARALEDDIRSEIEKAVVEAINR